MTKNANPTSVYTISDRDGVVIYVGMTSNVNARMRQHAKTASWASEARTVSSTEYPTRRLAATVEQALIETHRATCKNDPYVPIFGANAGSARHLAAHFVERFGSVAAIEARFGRPNFDRVFLTREA